ncbi:MAG: hydroxyacid dehydrogenase [Candidatus Eiseniibacteriota bacterium]
MSTVTTATQTLKALVADPLGAEAERILLQSGFEVKRETGLAGEALVAALLGRQALLVRGATRVTGEVIRAANGLRVIARAGAGTDNIDTLAASAQGIAVYNAPGANAVSVAEHTWGLIFSVLRHLPEADKTTREGRWEKNRLQGLEVAGRTLGVIGLGWVGREVARIGVALRCRVLGFDPDPEAGANVPGIERVGLEQAFQQADILSLHAPLSPQTRNLANHERMSRMKPGAILVNAARGGLVDEEALAQLLAQGRLGGAGLDVFEHEPPGENPLFALANVVVTPHLGGSTAEAQERAAIAAAQAVVTHLAGGTPPGRVV